MHKVVTLKNAGSNPVPHPNVSSSDRCGVHPAQGRMGTLSRECVQLVFLVGDSLLHIDPDIGNTPKLG